MLLLTILFLDNLPSADINKILKDEFSINTTPDIEKEVAELCNLSKGLVQKGRKEGIEETNLNSIKNIMQKLHLRTCFHSRSMPT